jgi:hypothetical protein
MESYIGAAPSSLISQLDFSLQSTAPYVIQRRSVRMYPTSASTFTPSTVNVCRLTLASEGEWLDPSTLRFVCTVVNNDDASYLYPATASASCLFQRVRELCGGTVISDVLNYARTAETFQNKLEPTEWQFSEGVLGFGGTMFGMPNVNYRGDTDTTYCPAQRHPKPGKIRPGTQYTCVQRLLTGICKSNKLIPLRVCPLTYELTLEVPAKAAPSGSQNYSLVNCYMLCDLITLDSSVQNSYYKSLLSGAALSLVIPQYTTVHYPVTNAASLAIVVQRAFTRNVAVFVTFSRNNMVDNFYYPDPEVAFQAFAGGPDAPILKDGSFSFQLQLGSKLWPEQPMSSLAEMYETLRKAVGTHNQDIKSIGLDRHDYTRDGFILGVDLEKNLGDPFSAVNTRAGDVLRLVFNGISSTSEMKDCYVHLISSSILEIRETGAFLFD